MIAVAFDSYYKLLLAECPGGRWIDDEGNATDDEGEAFVVAQDVADEDPEEWERMAREKAEAMLGMLYDEPVEICGRRYDAYFDVESE